MLHQAQRVSGLKLVCAGGVEASEGESERRRRRIAKQTPVATIVQVAVVKVAPRTRKRGRLERLPEEPEADEDHESEGGREPGRPCFSYIYTFSNSSELASGEELARAKAT